MTEEVQAEQDQERLFKIEDQLNTLKSAYVMNIAARVKSFWRYQGAEDDWTAEVYVCLLYTSPSPRDRTRSRMPSSA